MENRLTHAVIFDIDGTLLHSAAVDDALYRQIRQAFQQHMTLDGAHFQKPSRVDLLRRPL